MSRSPRGAKSRELPTKQQILAFVEERPGRVGKREIARAFGLRGTDRRWLNEVLRELEAEGLLERRRGRRVMRAGRLPEVAVIEVSHVDVDGEVVCRPVGWQEDASPPTILLVPSRHRRVAPGPGDRVLARLRRLEDGAYEARALRVLGPAARVLLGIFEATERGGLLRPTDRKHRHEYFIPQKYTAGAQSGDYVTAEVLPGGLRVHRARIVERLGASDDPGATSLIAIHTHGLPFAFDHEAVVRAEALRPAGPKGREDLRTVPFVTIDGSDARDFDDAVWAAPDGDPNNAGGWRLLVAIADVAWYVRPGDALDRAAAERGNSVYFPDRVIPMLPERLSTDLCSLRPHKDRPCLVAELRIDGNGRIVEHRFRRAVIRSAARLTYEQVQAAREGRPDDVAAPLVETVIEPLYGAFAALLRAREARGTLDLDLPELRIVLGEDGWVERVEPRARLDSHRLIEEFMIAANVAAAETLHAAGVPCLYRVHEPPDPVKIEELRQSLETLGLRLPKGSVLRARAFRGILERAKRADKGHLVSELILRSQSKAVYSPRDLGHFALALRRYCHFTSPIRRYADVLVHRALIAVLGLGAGGSVEEAEDRLEEVGRHLSETERRAEAAERDAIERFTVLYLADRIGATFWGRITGVTRFGLFVTLDGIGADGLVPASALPWDRYRHDPVRHALLGENSGLVFALGDRVAVRLEEADTTTASLVFSVVEGGRVDEASKRSVRRLRRRHHPSRTRRGGRQP